MAGKTGYTSRTEIPLQSGNVLIVSTYRRPDERFTHCTYVLQARRKRQGRKKKAA